MKRGCIIFLLIFLIACKPVREISDENKAKFDACKDSGNEYEVKNCEYNTALEIGYVEYCYDLNNENTEWHTKNECIMNVAEKQNDEKLCSYIKDKNGSNECYDRVALNSFKIEVCDNIDGEEKRNDCINIFAVKNNDVKKCDYFYNSAKYITKNGYSRDNCIYYYINSTGNVKLCKTIQSLQVKELPLCR